MTRRLLPGVATAAATASVPLLIGGGQFIAYARNRTRAARWYDRPEVPRDDGVRLRLDPVEHLAVLPLIDW